MRYKAVHNINLDGFIVKVGRSSNGKVRYVGPIFPTLKLATEATAKFNAEWLLEQARTIISTLTIKDAKYAAYEALNIVRDIDERILEEDPEDTDVSGWKA